MFARKRGGKDGLGTPFRSQNLQLVYRVKIVSWKKSFALMTGTKSDGFRERFDTEKGVQLEYSISSIRGCFYVLIFTHLFV